MTWFAVYEVESGRLVSQGSVVADPLPEGLAAVEIVEQNPEGMIWSPEVRGFVPIEGEL